MIGVAEETRLLSSEECQRRAQQCAEAAREQMALLQGTYGNGQATEKIRTVGDVEAVRGMIETTQLSIQLGQLFAQLGQLVVARDVVDGGATVLVAGPEYAHPIRVAVE